MSHWLVPQFGKRHLREVIITTVTVRVWGTWNKRCNQGFTTSKPPPPPPRRHFRRKVGHLGVGGGGDDCPVSQLWLSEGNQGLDPRVGKVVNSAVYLLLITTCVKLAFSKDIPVTPLLGRFGIAPFQTTSTN